MRSREQVVDVEFATSPVSGARRAKPVVELHRMRYFFPRELDYFLEQAGLTPVLLAPFLSMEGPPGERDWNVTVVARR